MTELMLSLPSSAARQSLAQRLGLPYADTMQDWEWEVASPDRFEDFLRAYRTADLSDDERVSLMEMLIQCVEDMQASPTAWGAIEPLLRAHPDLHGASVLYWAMPQEQEEDNLMRVSRPMRKLLRAIARETAR
ncbi:hypothetical protein J2X20_003909 [Pelomonas saccharophila]|uniref:CdiI immunity protein domain-containing protein n=1 Tax=Roseateles saccharophilus TaxID=304 RepID=A0ABU1YTE3_ROSSA|nr:hypothetical protein [Roseateles saccharophilus]MDR7271241.1 hypothetical protein [Roseateles saccharophilus]